MNTQKGTNFSNLQNKPKQKSTTSVKNICAQIALRTVITVFVVILAIAFGIKNLYFKTNRLNAWQREIAPKYPFITESVKKIQWDPDRPFAEEIAARNEPVILKNTIVTKWRAFKLWKPNYLIKRVPYFRGVQHHHNRVFTYFHADHPMSNLSGIKDTYQRSTYNKVNMTSEEFFKKISHPPFKEFYYYTALANDLGEEVYADLAPLEPLMVKNASFKADIAYKLRWTNVWIGPSGATTHTHYDIFYNFYAQLYGRKRFILFPPTERPHLYLYPFLHPGAQQSQVNLDAPNLEDFPLFEKARAVEAILEPGDVLFLPPMWFHHVTALDLSISVSVWTFVSEVEEMWALVRKPIPLRSNWSPPTLQYATRVFLEKIIDGLYGPGSAKPFVKQLLSERYATLLKQLPHLLANDASYCVKDLLAAIGIDQTHTENMFPFHENAEEVREIIEDRVNSFRKVKNQESRDIWLGNLCEQLALTVTDVNHVVRFLVDFVNC